MRTVSMALLLSLAASLTVACAPEEGTEAPSMAATQGSQPEVGSAPEPTATTSTAMDEEPRPLAIDAGAPADGSGSEAPAVDGGASPQPDSGVIVALPGLLLGRAHVSERSGTACRFTVDGVDQGTRSSVDLVLSPGQHSMTCTGSPGWAWSGSVDVKVGETSEVLFDLAYLGDGTVVAVSVGGPCTFSINGVSSGTSSSLRIDLRPGAYTVTCKSKVASLSKAVVVRSNETAMVTFQQP